MAPPKPPENRDVRADFAGDVSPAAQDELAEISLTLSELLPSGPPPAEGAARLARAIARWPLRYAPFYRRLSSLWQLDEGDVRLALQRAGDVRSWSRTLLPGVKTFDLDTDRRSGMRRRLMKLSPGAHFPRHRHRGEERVLVLEGSYSDSSGCEVRTGDEQLMRAGSEHELLVLGTHDCVAALTEQGFDFTGPWLRWVSKLSG